MTSEDIFYIVCSRLEVGVVLGPRLFGHVCVIVAYRGQVRMLMLIAIVENETFDSAPQNFRSID